MTEGRDPSSPEYKPGDVANGHILTAAGWLPLRRLPPGSPGPYYAGDLLDGNAYTGEGWVHVPVERAAGLPRTSDSASAHLGQVSPSPSLGSGVLRALGIGLAVLVFLGAIGVAMSTLEESDETSESTQGTDRAPAEKSAVTPKKKTKPKRQASPTPAAPDPEAKYAEEMERLGWKQAADDLWYRDEGMASTQFMRTWKVRVVSPTGCPNGVYVRADIYDASNTVIGFANDLLPSLPADQQAILELTSTAEGTITFEATESRCY